MTDEHGMTIRSKSEARAAGPGHKVGDLVRGPAKQRVHRHRSRAYHRGRRRGRRGIEAAFGR